MERVAGIEPASSAWKAEVLPLNYTRYEIQRTNRDKRANSDLPKSRTLGAQFLKLVVGAGFEPAKLSRQIYSLIPLATREPHHLRRYFTYRLFNVKCNLFYSQVIAAINLLDSSTTCDLRLTMRGAFYDNRPWDAIVSSHSLLTFSKVG